MNNNIGILIDARMKSKIESLMDWNNNGQICYSLKFKDIGDSFWFNDKNMLQEFFNNQSVERFYDGELRKGYFDYVNEHGNIIRYYVEAKRGTLKVIDEECLH
jgi:hypothetical protein